MIFSAILHAPLTVGTGPGGWSILDGRGFRAPATGSGALELRPVAGDGAPTLTAGDRSFPGDLRLVPRRTDVPGAFDVVNHVPLERYLPGVLARELYRHWHLQTHAAQAVAARSFACSEHAFFNGRRHYDLTDTAASQVYGGSAAHPRAREAVDMTRGTMLAWEDLIVPGYYSSCCGGPAADARDAIGEHPFNDVPPLHGRPGTDVCAGAPLYAWTIERPVADLIARIRAYGGARSNDALARVTRLRAIEVASRNAHGRPRSYMLRADPDVSVSLAAEELRRAADFGIEGVEAPEEPLWSSNVTVAISRRTARFTGRGHGHGAGLCQYGAEALAQAGEKYDAILEWYYPGAELAQAYESRPGT